MENLGAFKDPRSGKRIGTYGSTRTRRKRLLLDSRPANVKIDAKTRNATVYRPRLRIPRGRARVDHEGRLGFAEYQGNAIACSIPDERFTEWKVPTPWSAL